jgi:outer membrane protein assembly factor BamB
MINHTTLPPTLARVASLLVFCAVSIILPVALAQSQATSAQSGSSQQTYETTLHWNGRANVTRYRLQVALDPRFDNIIYDGAVVGLEHKISLPAGRYYWHVAPAPKETGRFSMPFVIEIPPPLARTETPTPTPSRTPLTTPSIAPRVTPTVAPRITPTPVAPLMLRSPANVGWETATGRVDRTIPAHLRAGQPLDLVAVNSEGTVFALEGATGAALWTTRFVPGRQTARAETTNSSPSSVFTPVVVPTAQRDSANVLVAFDGGVRLLEGETGRELWRVSLSGRATGGCIAALEGDASVPEIAVTTEEPNALYILNSESGAIVSHSNLDGAVVGVPIPFQHGADRGIALSLKGAQLDVRRANGERLRGVKFDVPFVTPPLVLASPRGTLVVVGTEHGLLFLDGDLKPLGRIATEGDSPHGRLSAADLDGNGTIEIVMVTTTGRVAVISSAGKIAWSASGARGAYSTTFIDLNQDGYLDVLVADEGVFARAFSGRDGSIIWQADDEPKANSAASKATDDAGALRSIVIAPNENGAMLLVGGDRARGALRAVGLPVATTRTAPK